MRVKRGVIVATLVLTATVFLLEQTGFGEEGGNSNGEVFKEARTKMGTVVEIACFGKEEGAAKKAFEAAFEEIERLEGVLSEYRPDSTVSKINDNAGENAVKSPPEVIEVIRKALEVSALSQGAFDVTFAGVGKLWNFRDNPEGVIPSDDEIKKSRKLVNYRNVMVDGVKNTVYLKQKGMKIALGGLSKGYIVDRALKELENNGQNNCYVNAGGDIGYIGDKGGKAWKIGLQDPDKKREYVGVASLKGRGALVTSGDYERYFEKGGKRYHHIIDPKEGYPVWNKVRSVTVVAPTAMEADAFATAIFVLGPQKGIAFANKFKGIEAAIIVEGGKEPIVTEGMKGIISWSE